MPFLFLIIGAIIGGVLEGDEGALIGAMLGFLAGLWFSFTRRIAALQRRVQSLDHSLAALREEMAPVELDLHLPADLPTSPVAADPSEIPSVPGYPLNEQEPVAAALGSVPAFAPDLGHPGQVEEPVIAAASAEASSTEHAARESQTPGWQTAQPAMATAAHPEDALFIDAVTGGGEPSIADRIFGWIRSANPMVLVGIIILFFGIAFGLKLAVDGGLVPLELRVAGVALFGMALWALGWRMRHSNRIFALPVQGAGAGVGFLTVFAAYAFYDLVPSSFAFTMLLAMVILTALMAVAQSSQALAALGVTGGFLAPVLVSSGSGNYVGLFSFYLLLNVLILSVAWFNAWRALNLLGFFFTFGIATFWGYQSYQPEFFASTEPFLIAFVLLYVAVSVLFALRQPPALRGLVDGTLIFGTPLVAFGLQSQLLDGDGEAMAISAVVAAAFYVSIAFACIRGGRDGLRTLGEAFLANGIIFATLAVPLLLDARWTAATWALEGAGVVWIAVRQNRLVPRLLGSILPFLAGAALMVDFHGLTQSDAFFNSEYLGAVLVAIGSLFCGTYMLMHTERLYRWEPMLAVLLAIWGLLWWFGAGAFESAIRVDGDYRVGVWLVFASLSVALFNLLAQRFDVAVLRGPAFLLVPTLVVTGVISSLIEPHPFESLGWLGWPMALAAHFLVLRRLDVQELGGKLAAWLHGGGVLLVVGIVTWAVAHFVETAFSGDLPWEAVTLGFTPAIIALLTTVATRRIAWPFVAWRGAYLMMGVAPLICLLAFWLVLMNFMPPGNAWPIAYLPILNPIDVACGFAILAAVAWWRLASRAIGDRWPLQGDVYIGPALVGLALFMQANAIILRSVHFWQDVPYTTPDLFSSDTVQTAFAIFWGVTGLVGMALANRRGSRAVWFAAASLMGIVVLKLFTVDLANTGTMERVVSFVSVGVALMAVGYFAPVPPRDESAPSDNGEAAQ